MATQPPVSIHLPFASASDIVRAKLKDLEYISALHASMHAVLVDVVPNAILSSPTFSALLAPASRLLYGAATLTLSPRRTPGDEYVGLLPVRGRPHVPVVRGAAVALAILGACGGGTVIKLARVVWNRLRSLQLVEFHFPAHTVESLVSFCIRLHLAIFYVAGTYYEVANRVLGVGYVRTAAPLYPEESSANRYQLLGVLLGIQLAVGAFRELRSAVTKVNRQHGGRRPPVNSLKHFRSYVHSVLLALVQRDDAVGDGSDTDGEDEVVPNPSSLSHEVDSRDGSTSRTSSSDARVQRRKCTLCLGKLKDPTLTTCGHVFCWRCVAGWCSTNEACPLCRHPIRMHRDLFALSNF